MRNKKVLIIIASITLVLIIILGSSYAYLRIEKKSGDQNISIANFGLVIKEDMKAITLDNEVPKSDEEGLKNTPNTFVIKNEGDVTAKYRLSLVDGIVASTMSNLDIRYRVKRTRSSGEEIGEVKSLGADGVFDEGIIASNEEISFELVIWINYDANPNGLKYSKVLSLEGLQADTLDTSGANPPEMLPNMIPVYYDKISDTEGVWRKADITNRDTNNKWYDYNDFMWANAVTVKDKGTILSDSTFNSIPKTNYYTVLENGDIYFDGVNDYYNLGHANENLESNLSIVVRFKVNNFSTNTQHIIGNPQNGGFYLQILNSKKIFFGILVGGAYTSLTSSISLTENEWYTVVATYDNTNMKLYISKDGELLSSESKQLSGTITKSAVSILLGGDPAILSFPNQLFLNGTIRKAMVYNTTFTDADVEQYFKDEITDYPENDIFINVGRENFEKTQEYYKVSGDGKITFEGNGFLNLGYANYNFKNTISIVSNFKVNSFSSNSYIIGNAEGAGFYLQSLSNKKIQLGIHNGSNYNNIDSSKNLEEGKWYTVIVTYDGSKMQIYVYQDGKLLSKDEQGLTGNMKVSSAPLMLGSNPSYLGLPTDVFLNGSISSTFIYTDVLSESEIENYFSKEITNYPKDNLLVGYDNFKEKSSREVYLNANPGTEISMDDITSMWVWIPRYKYTIFNGNNETANEQMINVEFERGINSTGTVSCHDDIQTDDNSDHSEICTDTKNNGIVNGVSTYTHPAFTFGSDELVGFWFAKFEMGTEDESCLSDQANNCNKTGIDIYIKPDEVSLRHIAVSNSFANLRSMELYGNIHGFPQSEKATSYLDTKGNLSGEIPNDSNNYDIHMIKNMEWGAVSYLAMSKYGKYGNNLYKDEYKEIYKNNYRTGTASNNYILKTGYSGGLPTIDAGVNVVSYNNLTIKQEGQGYIGAGASTTGTIYGIYDMNGGSWEQVMANMVDTNNNFSPALAETWSTTNKPLDKYYDKYSYNVVINSNKTRGKLGDATKEVIKDFSNQHNGAWYGDFSDLQHSDQNRYWLGRGGLVDSVDNNPGMFHFGEYTGAGDLHRDTSRPVLVISRDFS